MPEAARQIIKEQVQGGGDALPWGNRERYARLMMDLSIACYLENVSATSPTFFDRGIPDTLCYAQLIRLPVVLVSEMRRLCEVHRYNPRAFIAPPWPEIYEIDNERKQTWEEAVDVYFRLVAVYRDCGYELLELPKVNPKMRADFILQALEVGG